MGTNESLVKRVRPVVKSVKESWLPTGLELWRKSSELFKILVEKMFAMFAIERSQVET